MRERREGRMRVNKEKKEKKPVGSSIQCEKSNSIEAVGYVLYNFCEWRESTRVVRPGSTSLGRQDPSLYN